MRKILFLLILILSFNLQAKPFIRFGELVVKPEKVDVYREAIKEDIVDSMKLEKDVYTMGAMPKKDKLNDFYVIEIYKDADYEKVHREMPHYKKFYETTKDIFDDKKGIEIVPIFISETKDKFLLGDNNVVIIRNLKTSETDVKKIKDVFSKNYLLEKLEAIYVSQLKNSPQEWVVIEVYKDENSMKKSHLEENHKKYKEILDSIFTDNGTYLLDGNILENRGNLKFN